MGLFYENDREIWPKGIFRSRLSIFGQPPRQALCVNIPEILLVRIGKISRGLGCKYRKVISHTYQIVSSISKSRRLLSDVMIDAFRINDVAAISRSAGSLFISLLKFTDNSAISGVIDCT